MNTLLSLGPWSAALGVLAAQVAGLIGLAGIVALAVHRGRPQRAVWVITSVALAGLCLNYGAGLDRAVAQWLRTGPKMVPRFVVRASLAPSVLGHDAASSPAPGDVAALSDSATAESSVPEEWQWPLVVWLAGVVVLGGRFLLSRGLLAWRWRRGHVEASPEIARRATNLAERLGLRRRVRFAESSTLASPIAFGGWRPTVALPTGFAADHSRAEQDAILAHELAHLAAGDPFWHALSDAVAALLWWHPMTWWARRQLRSASETAADEACLLVEDGPATLARCLVTLARRLEGRRISTHLAMAGPGFRSGLGQRVERLLRLETAAAVPRFRSRVLTLGLWAVGLTVLVLLLVATALVLPAQASQPPALFALAGQARAGWALLFAEASKRSDAGSGRQATGTAEPRSAGETATQPTTPPLAERAASRGAASVDLQGKSTHEATDTVTVEIVKDGRILLQGREVGVAELEAELVKVVNHHPGVVAHLRVDDSGAHATVLRVMEACRASGISRFSLSSPPPHARASNALALTENSQPAPPGAATPAAQIGSQPGSGATKRVAPSATSANRAETEGKLFTRVFRLDPQRAREALDEIVGKGPIQKPLHESMRDFLSAAGLDFGLPSTNIVPGLEGGIPASTQGKAAFFNEHNSLLYVRATLRELDLVEQALQVINETPPQVQIEAKFVEVRMEDAKALGFDWFLGAQPMGNVATGVVDSNAVATVNGAMSDPQFSNRGVFPGQPVGTTNLAATPWPTAVPQDLRGDQLVWPGRDATNAQNLRVLSTPGTFTGILTDPQFRVVLQALQGRAGAEVLSTPRITTLSGRQAQIQAVEMKTVLSSSPSTNGEPPSVTPTQVPLGPVLDIIPFVSADGRVIDLTVIASVTEFLGYEEPPKHARQQVVVEGKKVWVEPALPRFSVRQMQGKASVLNGQTLCLGSWPVTTTNRWKDKVPVLGDIPGLGPLFRKEGVQTTRKNLMLFVTATIIDPAGNPVQPAGQ